MNRLARFLESFVNYCVPYSVITVVLVAFMGYSSFVSAQTWTAMPGAATDVGANAAGVVWVISNNPVPGGYTILRWNQGNWQTVTGGAVRISVDTDGTAWVVNNTGQVFHSNTNNQFIFQPGSVAAADIGVGAKGDLWIIGTNSNIYKAIFSPGTRNVSSWQQVPGGAARIAVGPDGKPSIVNQGGQIFRYNGSSWDLLPGQAKDIAVGPDGEAYVAGTNPTGTGGAAIYKWQGSNWAQIGVMGANVAAGPAGTVYVTQDQSTHNAILTTNASAGGVMQAAARANTSSVEQAAPQANKTSVAQAAPQASNATPSTQSQPGLQAFDFCWRNTHGRGVGTPLSTNSSDCPAGTVKDPGGLLCYPPCKAGYEIKGPLCRHMCPSGWNGDEVSCYKPTGYDRSGQTYPVHALEFDNKGMFSRCEADHGRGNCEEIGLIVYPKCKQGYHPRGSDAFACDPDGNQCPSGMLDSVAMCTRDSYGNGVGQVLGCAPGLDKSGLLCYPSCGANSDGVGPECWDRCPGNWVQCGAGCSKTTETCVNAIQDQVVSVLSAAAMIASEVLTAGATAGGIEAGKYAKQAGEDAADMVGKLKIGKAVQSFPKYGLDRVKVTDVLKGAFKPNAMTVTTKVASGIDEASQLVTNIVGITQTSGLTQDEQNWQIAQAVLQTTSLVDPTGIGGVIAAYTKPLCSVVTETASSEPIDLDSADRDKVRREAMGDE